MEGRYRVAEVDKSTGMLHLRGGGGRRFRVRLGPTRLATFAPGMQVCLRNSEKGKLVLETNRSARLSDARWHASGNNQPRRDRRAVPRVQFNGKATVITGSKKIQCEAPNLSERGIALRLPKYERLEDSVEIAFKLPNWRHLLRVHGVVSRVGRGPSETVWGVGFREVTEDAAGALQAFLAANAGGTGASRHTQGTGYDLAELFKEAVASLKDDPSSS